MSHETPLDWPKIAFPLEKFAVALDWAFSRAAYRGCKQRVRRRDLDDGRSYWFVDDIVPEQPA